MTKGTIIAITPIIGLRPGKKKNETQEVIEYERIEVMFDGDFTGYGVVNNFKTGTYQVGGLLELKAAE